MKHKVLLILLLGLSGLMGCEKSASTPRDPAARRAAGELAVALQDDGVTLDPHRATDVASMHLAENLYSGLLRYAPQYGEVEPDLADRYTISDDGRTYTFHLRRGAHFHSGRPVTAADVIYSIERIRTMERAAHFEAVTRLEAPDDHTVILHLDEPFAPLLIYLAHPMNVVVDRQVVEANNGLDRTDGGCGPFRLAEWRKAQQLVLQRHEQYHLPELPMLRQIVFLPMPDATSRTIALRNGEIDMILDVSGRGQRVLDGAAGIELDTAPGTFWEYVGLNTTRAPLDDVRVRQAIAWAIDRQAINQAVKLGAATVLTGAHIPEGHWAYAGLDLYPQRDLDRARQLLAAAGVNPGEVTLVCRVGSAFPYQVAAAQMIKQQLRDIGIEVQLLAQESGVFFDALGRSDFDMTVVGWVGFVDPDEWMYELFHSQGKYNQQKYANSELDGLLERGRRVIDRQERAEIYHRAQEIVATEAPMVFLYVNDQTTGRLADVRGFVAHPTASTIFLRATHFDDQAIAGAVR